MRFFAAGDVDREAHFFSFNLYADRFAHVSEHLTLPGFTACVFGNAFEKQARVEFVGVEESVGNVDLGQRVSLFRGGAERRTGWYRVHLNDPAEIVRVRRIEPIELPGFVDFESLNGG